VADGFLTPQLARSRSHPSARTAAQPPCWPKALGHGAPSWFLAQSAYARWVARSRGLSCPRKRITHSTTSPRSSQVLLARRSPGSARGHHRLSRGRLIPRRVQILFSLTFKDRAPLLLHHIPLRTWSSRTRTHSAPGQSQASPVEPPLVFGGSCCRGLEENVRLRTRPHSARATPGCPLPGFPLIPALSFSYRLLVVPRGSQGNLGGTDGPNQGVVALD
jgi:hypothetical protein